MFGLSGEHLLILAAILLIFGPRKLPELGSSIGRAFRNFKDGLNGPSTMGNLESQDPPRPSATTTSNAESKAAASQPSSEPQQHA